MQRRPVRSLGASVDSASTAHASISQRVHELRAQAEIRPESIGEIYDALYLKHFGRRSWRRPSLRDNTTFGRVFAFCVNRDVDVAEFISANMLILRPYLGRRPFYPNMLVGPNAERRYNGVLGRANRRFQTGSTRVFESRETWLGKIRTALATSEQEVAELFCALRLQGDDITFDECAKAVRTTQEWDDFRVRTGCYNEIAKWYGQDGCRREALLAQLTAAWSIAEKHRHGLADCIGVTDFSWVAFVRLLKHLGQGVRQKPEFEFAAVAGGSRWGNW